MILAAPAFPLPTLLSQALVAFTIEFDNESEHRMAHRTSRGPARSSSGSWLTSQVMWANFMQFVDETGRPLHEVEALARITNLGGLERWGYVRIEPDPRDPRSRPPAVTGSFVPPGKVRRRETSGGRCPA